MNLNFGKGSDYLVWNSFRFGSDSITASFRYKKYRYMIEQVAKILPDYRSFMENYIRKTYTIGGEIIFPKRQGGINQRRGCDPYICDRFDLTLECIRRFYIGEQSPLTYTLEKDRNFFELFVDFKGYVDFFFLQDMVSNDYESVLFWSPTVLFNKMPLPVSVEEYLMHLKNELMFVEKRNLRIMDKVGYN